MQNKSRNTIWHIHVYIHIVGITVIILYEHNSTLEMWLHELIYILEIETIPSSGTMSGAGMVTDSLPHNGPQQLRNDDKHISNSASPRQNTGT